MSGPLVIREARADDDTVVGELLVSAFLTAYAAKLPEVARDYSEARKADLRDVASKRRDGLVLVAEEDGVVVGTVTLYPPGAPRSEAWRPAMADLRQLAVAPSHFGRGVAGPLMDAVLAAARAQGVKAVGLHVRRGAVGVARLYERLGFRREPVGDLSLPEVELEAFVLDLA